MHPSPVSLPARDEIEAAPTYATVGSFVLRLAILLAIAGVLLRDDFVATLGLASLGFVAVAWLWNRYAFHGLTYTRTLSEQRVFPGEPVTLTLALANHKPLPLTWLQVSDEVSGPVILDGDAIPVDPATQRGHLLTTWQPGPFETQKRRLTLRCDRRGIYDFGPAAVTSGDGFSFFRRTQRWEGRRRLIVYPRLYRADELALPARYPFGTRATDRQLIEDPLHTAGIREWLPGDPVRRIHWLATARHQRLLSRHFESSQEAHVLIALNVATLERHWEGVVQDLLERTISVAASLAVQCVERKLPVGLIANAYWPESDQLMRLMPGRSPDQLPEVLEMLAAISGYANRPLEEVLLRECHRLPWGSTLLVVTPIAHEALLQALAALPHLGLQVTLLTLAAAPPDVDLPGIHVFYLQHLVDDLIVPEAIA